MSIATTPDFSKSNASILSPNDFANRIRDHKSEIVTGFLTISRALVPAAASSSQSYVKDHLPEVIDALVNFLNAEGGRTERSVIILLGKSHGSMRAGSERYSIVQLQKEFSIVREIILTLLAPTEYLSGDTVNVFAEFCELTLSTTTESYLMTLPGSAN